GIDTDDVLLAVDVGNTRIGLALGHGSQVHSLARVESHDPSRWRDALEQALQAASNARNRHIAIASVAPAPARQFPDPASDTSDVDPLIVGDDIPLPMPLHVDVPEQVGVDRVCSAAAAFDRLKTACAVASFGTAITVDFVSAAGHFLGGTILP